MDQNDGCHRCAPKEFRGVRDVSGSYELDAMIQRTTNRDALARLEMYTDKPTAYGPLTGYDGYHGYHGDN